MAQINHWPLSRSAKDLSMPRASIKERKRTVVCKDCKKTVSDFTWNELEAQGWD
jgi:hypothetical protein